MSFIGTIQGGPNADSYKEQAPAIISTVPASGVVNPGTPVRRNYLAIQGQLPGAYQFAGINPPLGITGGDQVVFPVSTAGGWLYGVYSGPPIANTSSPATSVVTPYVTRQGLTPVLVGAASGGTAVTVGSVVGMNVLQAASGGVGTGVVAGAGFATVLTAMATTYGSILGTVCGTPIVTALASNVTAGTSTSFLPLNVGGMNIGSTGPNLTVNPGAPNQEVISPSSISPGIPARVDVGWANASAGAATMTFVLGNASTGAIPGIPGGIIGVTIACTTATTGANFATSITAALNTAFSVYGEGPSNIPGIGGIRPFGLVTASTSVMSITAAIPSPAFNAVQVSAGAGTSSMTYPTSLAATSVGSFASCFATFVNNHLAGEPVVGTVTTSGATLCPVPAAGGVNVMLAMVDLSGLK